jgi:hypothetical protein
MSKENELASQQNVGEGLADASLQIANQSTATFAYKPVSQGNPSNADKEEKSQSADFRTVPHGQGPCACYGPYNE